jgi:hypothetical protein
MKNRFRQSDRISLSANTRRIFHTFGMASFLLSGVGFAAHLQADKTKSMEKITITAPITESQNII